jgi:putative hemolysin
MPTDLTEAIVGALRSDTEPGEEPAAVRREDGSWLMAGWMPVDEMAALVTIALPAERGYHTAAGFVLAAAGRLPPVGGTVETQGWYFEVVNLDGRRIDKLLARPARAAIAAAARRPGSGPPTG